VSWVEYGSPPMSPSEYIVFIFLGVGQHADGLHGHAGCMQLQTLLTYIVELITKIIINNYIHVLIVFAIIQDPIHDK
jgi:hypothetical protein